MNRRLNDGQYIYGIFFPNETILNFTDDEFNVLHSCLKSYKINWCKCETKKISERFIFHTCLVCKKHVQPKEIQS